MVSSFIIMIQNFAKRVQFFLKMILRLRRRFLAEDVSKNWLAFTQ